jgi:hypothetical protein
MVFKPLDSQVALSQKESGSRIVSYGPLIVYQIFLESL